MSDDIILKAVNISKQYRLGLVGTGTLSHDLNRLWAKIRGKEDPYLQVGAVNDRSASASSDYVWALQDINFEVKRGEILGIIGKNGAGKSTLLKILSRVTSPTTGSIKTGGRIASLLEVGTGMHPELTGRENIFLNGAILGMNKTEISSKIDEIIEFSGCQMYIDTPVKRYSSGMRVRLGFAVAAFLEPDILVVDEVLAVGDAEFQKKAIGKMQDISNTNGRTVLFVSHNMAAVRSLCTRAIVLENGRIVFGNKDVNECISFYLKNNNSKSTDKLIYRFDRSNSYGISKVSLNSKNNKFDVTDDISLTVSYNIESGVNTIVAIYFRDSFDDILFFSESTDRIENLSNSNSVNVKLPTQYLKTGSYSITVGIRSIDNELLDVHKDILQIDVYDTHRKRINRPGKIILPVQWKVNST
jgi:lipopolysaccharide transport system ATP-binding protein